MSATAPIPDEDHGVDLPMTMSASVILTKLPGDTREALEREAERLDGGKGEYSCILLFCDWKSWYRFLIFVLSVGSCFVLVLSFLR